MTTVAAKRYTTVHLAVKALEMVVMGTGGVRQMISLPFRKILFETLYLLARNARSTAPKDLNFLLRYSDSIIVHLLIIRPLLKLVLILNLNLLVPMSREKYDCLEKVMYFFSFCSSRRSKNKTACGS